VLGLGFTIALGILVVLAIIAALPTVTEAAGALLAVVVGIGLVLVMLLVAARVLGVGFSSLGVSTPWLEAVVGWIVTVVLWLLAILVALAWLTITWTAIRRFAALLRGPPGSDEIGAPIFSAVLSIPVFFVPWLLAWGPHPVLPPDWNVELPPVLRLTRFAPVVIGFASLIVAVGIEMAKRVLQVLHRARGRGGETGP
jgi:hypothetical protein